MLVLDRVRHSRCGRWDEVLSLRIVVDVIALAQSAFALDLCEGGSASVASATLFPAFTAPTASAVARWLVGAGRAEQMDHLGAVDELQFGKRQNAIAIERWLERKVEAGERLTVVRRDILSAVPLINRPGCSQAH